VCGIIEERDVYLPLTILSSVRKYISTTTFKQQDYILHKWVGAQCTLYILEYFISNCMQIDIVEIVVVNGTYLVLSSVQGELQVERGLHIRWQLCFSV